MFYRNQGWNAPHTLACAVWAIASANIPPQEIYSEQSRFNCPF